MKLPFSGSNAKLGQHEQAGSHSRSPCSPSQGQSLHGGCPVPDAICCTAESEPCGNTRKKACALRSRQKLIMHRIFIHLHVIGISTYFPISNSSPLSRVTMRPSGVTTFASMTLPEITLMLNEECSLPLQ